jgi:hypothetical protein
VRPAENPFRTSRTDAIEYRFVDGGFADLRARLEASGGRGLIVGPEGSGKTTLLRRLAEDFEARGLRVRSILLREGERRMLWSLLDGVGAGDAVLLDGTEQLPFTARLRFLWRVRRASIVVATAHRELLGFRTLQRNRTTPALLEGLVRTLDPAAGEDPELLWRRHGGNVREALRALYDARAGSP